MAQKPKFSLSIAIDQASLDQIYAARQRITLARSVTGSPLASDLEVVWLQFDPFESNTVAWPDICGVFVSGVPVQDLSVIAMSSSLYPASRGVTYTLQNGTFSGAASAEQSTYRMVNAQSAGLSFGLMQMASVNGRLTTAPFSVGVIDFEGVGSYDPTNTVSVRLLSAAENGMLIRKTWLEMSDEAPVVSGKALTVSLSDANPTAALGFDAATNSFFAIS